MPVNWCNYVILITIVLQLSFFLGVNSNKCIAIDIAANVVYLICGKVEKTFCLKIGKWDGKTRFLNTILLAPEEIMRII